jgi:methylthioribose-1-phosphate isomerase
MKMLVVDDEEFELELNKSMRCADIITMPAKGRNGAKATPDSLRKLIAHDAIEGAPARDVAEAYGVSESSVSAYKVGATSTTTYHEPSSELKQTVDFTRDRIKSKAQNKLLLALKHMTEDKIKEVKPIELSTIAANMSRVVEKMSPKQEGTTVNNNIVFYSPKQISKENYETVDVLPDMR